MSPSYHKRILRVDLSSGQITVDEPNDAYYRRYMGGWNVVADVLLREVPAGADPLGPENRLIFAPGVLTGLALSGASRNAVGAKSPLTGGFGAAEVGGFWGAELKRAGYDALIVQGAAAEPTYLWIKDGQAELRSARHLWGQPTKETQDALREELGDRRVQCAMIGPGGENRVRYACIMNGPFDAAGRCGLGAVMGAKNLKAVAVRGTLRLEGADAEKVQELARWMARGVQAGEQAAGLHQYGTGRDLEGMVLTGNLPTRNFRDGDFAAAEAISADTMMETYGQGMDACYACAVRCKKVFRAESPYQVDPAYGGPEYETIAALGSCCGIEDPVAIAKANELCNAHGLDTIGAGVTVALAMECYENGLLTRDDTDGLDLRFGSAEALLGALERIARGTPGLGTLLGDRLDSVAARIGGEAPHYAMAVKGQALPMHEPRFKRALALGYAVSPTGADHCHSLHDSGLNSAAESGMLPPGTLSGLGVVEPLALESLGPEKVRAAMYHTMEQAALNSTCMCLFVPWTIEQKVELLRAATGWDVTAYELIKVGERAYTLAKLYSVREGVTADLDRLPERSYGPTRNGVLADGGIDREELQEAVQTFYGMMGWDENTGVPTSAKLHELGVSWAVEHLP